MPLYEVAILQKPTRKQSDDGGQETLVLGPKAVVAKTEQAAVVGAILQAKTDDPTRELDINTLEVLVRPFGPSR